MRGTDEIHDASLLAWTALAVARAFGWGRPGRVDALLVVVNLVSGTPSAWRRVRQGRHDFVTLAAPVAVGCAVAATARPRPAWTPAATTSVLLALRAAERRGVHHGPETSAPSGSRIARGPRAVTGRLVFDGDCGFCTRTADWMRRLDRAQRVQVVPYQRLGAPQAVGATRQQCRDAVQWLGPDDIRRTGADAINAALSTALSTPLPSRLYRLTAALQERVYQWVADHRGRLPGRTPYCTQHPHDCTAQF